MPRATLQSFTLVFAIATPLAGCELFLDVGDDTVGDGSSPRDELADQFNDSVLPLLDRRCSACHNGSRVGIDFMAIDGSAYDSVRNWPALVNFTEPGASRLLTKGIHEGPTWLPDERDRIIVWLLAEADARN